MKKRVEHARVNFRYATPVDFVEWFEKEFCDGISVHTKRRLAEIGISTPADLESFLLSVEPHELIWIVHPADISSFVLDSILRQIGIKEIERIISLKIKRGLGWGEKEVILVPLQDFEERVEVGDLLKSKLLRLWKSDLSEYSWSPHLRIAEMESLCLEIEHLRQNRYTSENIIRAVDDLFLRLSKAYEQYIRSLMYLCRAVLVQLFKDNEPAKLPNSADSWTLSAMEHYISREIVEWTKQSNIDTRQGRKLIGAVQKLLGDRIDSSSTEMLKSIRRYRNISVHDYLNQFQQMDYLRKIITFINNAKDTRLATGYVVSINRSATVTRLVMRLDGAFQNVNLLYRDLSLYTPFKTWKDVERAVYRIRVMAFPLSPDERRVFQPFLVKHGVFDKEGYCRSRSALCYENFEIEYAYVEDEKPIVLLGDKKEIAVEE